MQYLLSHGAIYGLENFKHTSSCLIMTVKWGWDDIAQALVQNGVDMYEKNNQNQTALQIAIQGNKKQLVKFFIEKMNFNLNKTENWYLLQIANKAGWKDVQLTLIQSCNDLQFANRKNFSIIQWIVNNDENCALALILNNRKKICSQSSTINELLFLIFKQQQKNLVDFLLNKGALQGKKNLKNTNCLIFAVKWGWDDIAQALVQNGVDMYEKNNQNQTALQMAIQGKKKYLVKLFIKRMNFNLNKTENWYLLKIANEAGWKDIQFIFIQSCNDLQIANKKIFQIIQWIINNNKKSALDLVLNMRKDICSQSWNNSKLLYYGYEKNQKQLVDFLSIRGVSCHWRGEYNETCLHWAAKYGWNQYVINLVYHNDRMLSSQSKNQTPLLWAMKAERKQTSQILIQKMYFNHINSDNWRYMKIANDLKWNNVMYRLIEKCQNIKDASSNDKNIIQWCLNRRDYQMIKKLIKQMQEVNYDLQQWSLKNGHKHVFLYLRVKQNEKKEFCLYWAARWGWVDIIKDLVNKGVDLYTLFKENTTCNKNLTALDVAASYSKSDAVQYLLVQSCLKYSHGSYTLKYDNNWKKHKTQTFWDILILGANLQQKNLIKLSLIVIRQITMKYGSKIFLIIQWIANNGTISQLKFVRSQWINIATNSSVLVQRSLSQVYSFQKWENVVLQMLKMDFVNYDKERLLAYAKNKSWQMVVNYLKNTGIV